MVRCPQELKRGHVVWQLRHTLSLLGKGCPVGPALKDVLIIEVRQQLSAVVSLLSATYCLLVLCILSAC